MGDVSENIKRVREEILNTCAAFSVAADSITLCAVSKTKPLSMIQEACSCGIEVFGENYVQEIAGKFVSPRNFNLRLIGHLQSNKVSKIVPFVDSIDSVDSLSLLKKIDLACGRIGKVMQVLFELNSSGEDNKSGFKDIDEFRSSLDLVRSLHNVRFAGLMTMGPAEAGESATRHAFEKFNLVAEKSKEEFPELDFGIRSFGMSADYKIAIEMGSNMLRIGSAIFGDRK